MITPIYEPFVGLTYNGVHSSTLGLYRVSDGSRYNEDLLPSFSDKTSERTGADGMYFFDSNYQEKNWTIEFAFDHVTKEQLRDIKRWLGKGSKKPLKLVFDEDRLYNAESEPSISKYYMAKVAQVPQIKSLCFEEEDESGNIVDIYKGELTVEFISYAPFGYGKIKYFKIDKENYNGETKEYTGEYTPSTEENGFNSGDIEAYPLIIIYNSDNAIETNISFSIEGDYGTIDGDSSSDETKDIKYMTRFLSIKNLPIPKNTDGIVIDFEKGIITGLKTLITEITTISGNKNYGSVEELEYITDNKIYNQYISEGDFFKIPLDSDELNETYKTMFIGNSAFTKIMCIREKLY